VQSFGANTDAGKEFGCDDAGGSVGTVDEDAEVLDFGRAWRRVRANRRPSDRRRWLEANTRAGSGGSEQEGTGDIARLQKSRLRAKAESTTRPDPTHACFESVCVTWLLPQGFKE